MTGTRDEEQHKHASQASASAVRLRYIGDGLQIAAWVTMRSAHHQFCMRFGLNDFEAGSLD
jgi:hypothetical protein